MVENEPFSALPLYIVLQFSAKGKIISKMFLVSVISSKKRTKEFDFNTIILVFVRFLEEIEKNISKLSDL